MNAALQNALTGLVSVVSLYVLLATIVKMVHLFFDLKASFTRERDLEIITKAMFGPPKQKDDTQN